MTSGDVERLVESLLCVAGLPSEIRNEIEPTAGGDTSTINQCVSFRYGGLIFTLPHSPRELLLYPPTRPDQRTIEWEKHFIGDRRTTTEFGQVALDDHKNLARLFEWLGE